MNVHRLKSGSELNSDTPTREFPEHCNTERNEKDCQHDRSFFPLTNDLNTKIG